MTNKEKFIQEHEDYISHETVIPFSEEAWSYFKTLKETEEIEKPLFTENGAKVLQWMRDNENQYNNIFKAKEIAEGLFTTSRSVSGSMRKLVSDGFVDKTGTNPSCYSLTEKGKICEIVIPDKAED